MGDVEVESLDSMESSLRYHSDISEVLTKTRYPGLRQCMVGSLTGAVSS